MSRKIAVLRFIIFCVFSGVGVIAFWVGITIDDLVLYYTVKAHRDSAVQTISRLQNLTEDYRAAIKRIESDPNVVRRLASVTLGAEPNSEGSEGAVFYPKLRPGQELGVKAALEKLDEPEHVKAVMPLWVERCRDPVGRIVLFAAGSGLIIIAFVFFGSVRNV
ncbi:MAG: hypothetical protein ABIG61_15920 [Planctomycetota bacterium]